MKVIDLQEAKANLEHYAVECRTSPVVVTQEGQPIFELLPIRPDDSGFLAHLIEHDPSFSDLVKQGAKRSGMVVLLRSNRSASNCLDPAIDGASLRSCQACRIPPGPRMMWLIMSKPCSFTPVR